MCGSGVYITAPYGRSSAKIEQLNTDQEFAIKFTVGKQI
jgi:hypothetical protein